MSYKIKTDSAKLASARIKQCLTQTSLAELVGVTKQFIGMIERGESCPSPDTAKKIAEYCKCEFDYLFTIEK